MKTTINQDKITYLSKKGMRDLKKSILQLEIDRQKSLQSLHDLDKTLGRDERLSRIERLTDLESIESEIDDKKLLLSTSKLLPTRRSHIRVAIGSVVDLIDMRGRLFHYKIVDSVEANPSEGRISTVSPIGRSLIGKTVQDVIEWTNGTRINRFYLTRIT